jgi:hypothetical protein
LNLIYFRMFFNFFLCILYYNFLNFFNLLVRNRLQTLNYLFSNILYNLICDYLNIFDGLFDCCTLQNSHLLNFFNFLNLLSLLNLLSQLDLFRLFNRFRCRLKFFDNFLNK